ncbi:aminotransferase class I/II-fold pyridoxal phosphate-dependent enzyme [Oceaniglobus roseus]|uniref:aminotransferase class I/II-fold pyridoxal phosphate-dependent enzyme n=1 Tax=Oceaniglobus roseus TaxID=1737570 RepID=UPI000C7F71EF|nr:aminotransferase class I/II-fold pyridoxal phosphate-dependent enzyme [Kandeliimicrobium roseum]
MTGAARDHGGGVDAAVARWGGSRADWLDLSTGINPRPWPRPALPETAWTALPDRGASAALEAAARRFWAVPEGAAVLAGPGASALIAQLPFCLDGRAVRIRPDTYNEHAAAFRAAGWEVTEGTAPVRLEVSPNNPTGEFWEGPDRPPGMLVVDESFCDTDPARSLIGRAGPGTVILKSFGKFWGLAGLRLGFAIGDPAVLERLAGRLGPWAVSGPALALGTAALEDVGWAAAERLALRDRAARLDALLATAGLAAGGDCPLFRLCRTPDVGLWHDALARRHILTREFPYAPDWLRLGLPPDDGWTRLEAALAEAGAEVHGTANGTAGGATAQPSAARRTGPQSRT